MTKLKTLRDIFEREFDAGELDSGECVSILEEELKAEAVKWVKRMRLETASSPTNTELWIRNFFNLKEDDLK